MRSSNLFPCMRFSLFHLTTQSVLPIKFAPSIPMCVSIYPSLGVYLSIPQCLSIHPSVSIYLFLHGIYGDTVSFDAYAHAH